LIFPTNSEGKNNQSSLEEMQMLNWNGQITDFEIWGIIGAVALAVVVVALLYSVARTFPESKLSKALIDPIGSEKERKSVLTLHSLLLSFFMANFIIGSLPILYAVGIVVELVTLYLTRRMRFN
jgi:ABC-type multidrug transport system permease subunit